MRINDFQQLIPKIKEAIELEVQAALLIVAEKIAHDARAKIGHDQPGWKPLADATLEEKTRKGESTPDPLLATGELRDSIKVIVAGKHAVIGTDDPVAVDQEGGTDHVPPRPFLSRAAMENVDFAEVEFAAALRKAFSI